MKALYGLLFMGLFFAGLLIPVSTSHAQTSASYDDVLLIVNDKSKNSTDIGNFFAQRRHIPAKNVFHIQIDTSAFGAEGETIDSATFKQKVWFPLENYMQANHLVSSINYIVTTKGDPLRVTTSDGGDDPNQQWFSGLASFNDCLALINASDSVFVLTRKNGGFPQSPYYGSSSHFKHDQLNLPFYLTTRLDAYTVDQVKSYIMKSDSTAVVGQGLFVLDVDPTKDGTIQNPSGYQIGNDWLRNANSSLLSQYMNVFLDTTTIYITQQNSVIGYASWGSNDANAGTYAASPIAEPHNTYLNGAIGETYVSTGGRSFNPGTGYGQSLIADWVAEGISAIKGYTDEPYLIVMAQPDILFPRYINGYNMAESYWSSSQLMAWRQVVIGDPKMMLKQALTAPSQDIALPDTERYIPESTQVTIPNTAGFSLTLHKPYMDASGDTSQFTASVPQGISFPYQLTTGNSLPLIVTFKGKKFGSSAGIVDVPYRLPGNNHDNLYQITANGKGLRPKLTVQDTLFFPTVTPPDTSVVTVTMHNRSKVDSLFIYTFGFSFNTNGTFNFRNSADNRTDTIFAGDSLSVQFIYLPTDSIAGKVVLNIQSSASILPTSVALIGYGKPAAVTERTALPPDDLSLAQNFPNPFTQFTQLSYFIPQGFDRSRISLKVFNVLGEQVADLTNFITSSGNGGVFFNAASLPEGTYFCRLSDGRTVRTTAMLHVK